MKRITFCAALAAMTATTLIGCGKSQEANNTGSNPPPGQPTANAIQNGADKTGQVLNNAAHDTGQALGKATTRAADLAQKAGASITGSTTQPIAAPDATDIREGLAAIVNDAVAKDSFSSLVKDFSSNTQARIGEASKQDFADIDGIVAQIQKDWNAKYGHDFKATGAVFNTDQIQIQQGPYIPPDMNIPGSAQSGIGTANADRNKGVVMFMSENAGTSFVAPMEKEGIFRSWKLDVPAEIDAQKLHDNLGNTLTTVKNSMSQWPADENEAYRMVARQVLAAILNTKAST